MTDRPDEPRLVAPRFRWALAWTAAIVAILLASSPLARLDRIDVVGDERTNPKAALQLAGVATGDWVVGLDTDEVARRVATLGTVQRADVSRPDALSLRIELTERLGWWLARRADADAAAAGLTEPIEPAADAASVASIGRDRVVIAWREDPSLVEVLVPSGSRIPVPGESIVGTGLGETADFVDAVVSRDWLEVVQVNVADPRDVTLQLADQTVVRIGRTDNLDNKLRALRAILDVTVPGRLASIDVRDPRSPVITDR